MTSAPDNTTTTTTPAHDAPAASSESPRLLRIQEVAAEVGLTTRSIRYYEEVGLLSPAARSEGAYRLYDPSDLERLRYIKGLRDDAGFSLAEIGLLLEDEAARQRGKAALKATDDPEERRVLVAEAIERLDRQIDRLHTKVERLEAMIDEARRRREALAARSNELDGRPDARSDARQAAWAAREVRK